MASGYSSGRRGARTRLQRRLSNKRGRRLDLEYRTERLSLAAGMALRGVHQVCVGALTASSASVPRHVRSDAPKPPPANNGDDVLDQPWRRRAQPAFERRKGRHRPRKNLHGPAAVNLGLCPFGRVGLVVVAAGSRSDDTQAPRALVQLENVAAPLQVSTVGVEAMNEVNIAHRASPR